MFHDNSQLTFLPHVQVNELHVKQLAKQASLNYSLTPFNWFVKGGLVDFRDDGDLAKFHLKPLHDLWKQLK